MKASILQLLGLFTASLNLGAESGEVLLFGIAHSPASATIRAPRAGFYVSSSRLAESPSWHPLTPFPLDLGVESQHAAMYLVTNRNLGSGLDLQAIRVRRFLPTQSVAGHPQVVVSDDFTNKWFAVFTFSTADSHELISTLMLMNRVYAQARNTTNRSDVLVVERPSTAHTAAESIRGKNPLEVIASPDLQIPSVQWNPARGPCPLTFEMITRLSFTSVSNKFPFEDGILDLKRVDFLPFVPREAVTARGLNLGEHMNHWICVTTVTSSLGREYDVYLLLDGSIVEVLQNGI